MSVTSPPSRSSPQYEGFYGFVESPFTLAQDPRFLYPGPSHEQAIRLLLQNARERKGVAVLSGDVGTGKTTVCRAVVEQLDPKVFASLLLNPFLSADELLREVLLDFGVVSRQTVRAGRLGSASRDELMSALREFLVSLTPIGASGMLVIDEAQHLTPDVLDHIHTLTSLTDGPAALLQIVLAGELTLLETLNRPAHRLLGKSVSLRTVLEPLARADVEGYVNHRLSVAGAGSTVSFEAAALDGVHQASGGVPRVINLLCDRALIAGAQAAKRTITLEIVNEAAVGLGLQAVTPPRKRWWQRLTPL